ncbi:MAG: T9SS type A sorting domain-containing protein [Bacteroidetes bacterium]|nr:T9SS type A sorting domain-containing protein [Bacteroidota bacterium]
MKKCALFLIVLMLITVSGQAQVPFTVSSSIGDKAVDVPVNTTLTLTFSDVPDLTKYENESTHSPLDWVSLWFQGYEGEGSPILSWGLSEDQKTLTLQLSLQTATVYDLRIWNAMSIHGQNLTPLTVLFTTGPALPASTISGTISGRTPGKMSWVLIFHQSQDLFLTDINSYTTYVRGSLIDESDGSFEMNHIPDGVYYLLAFEDLDGNGEISPEEGDRLYIHDTDQDGIPTWLAVQNPGSQTVNGTFLSMIKTGTSVSRTPAATVASEWSDQSQLMLVASVMPCDEKGEAGMWYYLYGDSAKKEVLSLIYMGSQLAYRTNLAMDMGEEELEYFFQSAIHPAWKNSEDLMPAVDADFRSGENYNPDEPIRYRCQLVGFFFGGLVPKTESGFLFPALGELLAESVQPGHLPFPEDQQAYLERAQVSKTLWMFKASQLDSSSDEWMDRDSWIAGALTGNLLSEKAVTASEVFQEFEAERAILEIPEYPVSVFAPGLKDDGTCMNWGIVTWDPVDHVHRVYFCMGTLSINLPLEFFPWTPWLVHQKAQLEEEWLNSDVVTMIADAFYESENGPLPEYGFTRYASLVVENRFFPVDRNQYWIFSYDLTENSQRTPSSQINPIFPGFTFFINSKTGVIRHDPFIASTDKRSDAMDSAQLWSSDAVLYSIESISTIHPDGKALGWSYQFMRAGTPDGFRVLVSGESMMTVPVNLDESAVAENDTLLGEWMESGELLELLETDYEISADEIMKLALITLNESPVWMVVTNPAIEDPAELGTEDIEDMILLLDAKTGTPLDKALLSGSDAVGLRAWQGSPIRINYDLELVAIYADLAEGPVATVWAYLTRSPLTSEQFLCFMAGPVAIPINPPVFKDAVELVATYPAIPPGWIPLSKLADQFEQYLETHPISFEIEHASAILVSGSIMDIQVPEGKTWWFVVLEGAEKDTVIVVDAFSGEMYTTVGDRPGQPQQLVLGQNYPNPFNPETTIPFYLKSGGRTRLILYNLLGQPVRVVFDQILPAGNHECRIQAGSLPTGMYLIELRQGTQSDRRKLMLLK